MIVKTDSPRKETFGEKRQSEKLSHREIETKADMKGSGKDTVLKILEMTVRET